MASHSEFNMLLTSFSMASPIWQAACTTLGSFSVLTSDGSITSGCESSGELAPESSVVLPSDASVSSSSSSSNLPHLPPRAIAIISYILLPSSDGLSGCGTPNLRDR
nr:hypothetical protein Iba_chr13eCG1410 [Ipomoea batatas]